MAITAPTDIANCGLWVRATDVPGAVGTTITSAPDSSGFGRNLTGVSGKLPTVGASFSGTAYGRKVFQFSGGQGFTAPNFAYNDFTIFVMFRPEAWGAANTYYGTSGTLLASESAGAAADYGLAVGTTGNFVVGTGNPDTFVTGGGLALNSWAVGIMDRTQTSGLFHSFVADLNGNVTTVGQATNNTNPLNASTNIGIGAVPTTTEGFFTGKIGELIVYSRVLTSAERQDVVNYFKNVYTYWVAPVQIENLPRQIRIPSAPLLTIDRFGRTMRSKQPLEPVPFKRIAIDATLSDTFVHPPTTLRSVSPPQYTKRSAITSGQLWPRGSGSGT